ncbi:MAG TPA: hypothetical protein PLN24_04555 [Victivallales bacterium]|nr:hypothetical protein [Victivallales bacterium]
MNITTNNNKEKYIKFAFSKNFKTIFFSSFIFVFSHIVFSPSLKNDFVWDDLRNFAGNIHLKNFSWENLKYFFTSIDNDNYFPITWLSIALDYNLWGENPHLWHLTNIILHGIASVIFFLLSYFLLSKIGFHIRESLNGAFIGGLLFSIHPLRVETVCWLSTRADILCAIFLQSSLFFYIKYFNSEEIRNSQDSRHNLSFYFYLLSLFFCLISFLCRPWAITFPFILLLLDFYMRKSQNSLLQLLIEKLPFFFMSMIFAFLAYKAKSYAMLSFDEVRIFDRLILMLSNFLFYIYKTIFPLNLSPLYPLDYFKNNFVFFFFSAQVTVFILIFCIIMHEKFRIIFLPVFAYMIILLPVSGISQVGIQFAADRYTYISTMPFFILFASIIAKYSTPYTKKIIKFLIFVLFTSALTFFPILSFKQSKIWENDYSLWTHVIQSGYETKDAYYNRGCYFVFLPDKSIKNYLNAENDFTMALEFDPQDLNSLKNRAKIRINLGKYREAIEDLEKLTSIKNDSDAILDKVYALEKLGYLGFTEKFKKYYIII